jgi:hypothetical protein
MRAHLDGPIGWAIEASAEKAIFDRIIEKVMDQAKLVINEYNEGLEHLVALLERFESEGLAADLMAINYWLKFTAVQIEKADVVKEWLSQQLDD